MKKACCIFLALMVVAPLALAQTRDFPNRTIKLVAPFGPGSGADRSGRFYAELLSKVLGQPAVVENRAGASGTVGAVAVKNAPADGYTLLIAGWSAQAVNPIVIENLPYDPIKDFRPISGLQRSALGFYVPANSKLQSLADLIAVARSSKQLLNVGTISQGQEIVLAWFGSVAGVKFQNVPYKNSGQMLTDAMAGQVHMAIENIPSTVPMVRAGKLRMLAATSETRHHEHPTVPTVKESGYPEFVNYGWSGLYVRSETPDEIVAVLADAMQKVLASPASQEYARKLGSEVMMLGPAAMRKYEADQLANFRRVAQAAGIKATRIGN